MSAHQHELIKRNTDLHQQLARAKKLAPIARRHRFVSTLGSIRRAGAQLDALNIADDWAGDMIDSVRSLLDGIERSWDMAGIR